MFMDTELRMKMLFIYSITSSSSSKELSCSLDGGRSDISWFCSDLPSPVMNHRWQVGLSKSTTGQHSYWFSWWSNSHSHINTFADPVIVSLLLMCRYLSLVRLISLFQLFLHLCGSLSEEKKKITGEAEFLSGGSSHMLGDSLRRATYSCWVPPWPTQCFCPLYSTSLLSASAPSLPLSASCEHTISLMPCATAAALH